MEALFLANRDEIATSEEGVALINTFGAESTADEVLEGIDLSGNRVLVTGVSAGLGIETARSLAAHGADVVGTARNPDKARATTAEVRDQAVRGGGLEIVELDLASLASVRACADRLVRDGRQIDVVIASAGVMAGPKGVTIDGFETQFGTNHLGHFVFINRIASLFAPGGRLVMVSSAGHRSADVDLEDPNFERTPYDEFAAYRRSKTANVLFAVAFDRRYQPKGIRATAVHPGAVLTETTQRLTRGNEAAAAAFAWKTVAQGAATSVWAGIAAAPAVVGGRYCEDCHVADMVDRDGIGFGVRPYALDAERAKALWAKSEEMAQERF